MTSRWAMSSLVEIVTTGPPLGLFAAPVACDPEVTELGHGMLRLFLVVARLAAGTGVSHRDRKGTL